MWVGFLNAFEMRVLNDPQYRIEVSFLIYFSWLVRVHVDIPRTYIIIIIIMLLVGAARTY